MDLVASEKPNLPQNHFPANREYREELQRKSLLLAGTPAIQAILDAMPGLVMILNRSHQVVIANRPLLEALGATPEELAGYRFGEIFGCSSWREGPDGCGTSSRCRNCSVLQTLEQSLLSSRPMARQCELSVDRPIRGVSLQLRVQATATSIQGEAFTVCAAEDVGNERRLEELTRLFFHDVLNMAGSLQAHLGLLLDRQTPGEDRDHLGLLRHLADRMVDEIESQRELALAESGDLDVHPQAVRVARIVDDLRHFYSAHCAGSERVIDACDTWDGVLVTDVGLLSRVLGNMLRNALEATEPGGTVGLRCCCGSDWVEFSVHNRGVIPEAIQKQIFRRSFSTKGPRGRGVGMRSIKILGEHYLGGSVGFTSSDPDGTTFFLRIPKVLEPLRGAGPASRSGWTWPGAARDGKAHERRS